MSEPGTFIYSVCSPVSLVLFGTNGHVTLQGTIEERDMECMGFEHYFPIVVNAYNGATYDDGQVLLRVKECNLSFPLQMIVKHHQAALSGNAVKEPDRKFLTDGFTPFEICHRDVWGREFLIGKGENKS